MRGVDNPGRHESSVEGEVRDIGGLEGGPVRNGVYYERVPGGVGVITATQDGHARRRRHPLGERADARGAGLAADRTGTDRRPREARVGVKRFTWRLR